MKNCISEDSIERTISACAWLVDIAQHSVDRYGWDPVIVRYLESLGQGTYESALNGQGGLGAVAPMKRSATDVEMLAGSDAHRGTNSSRYDASTACHDRQIGLCVPLGKLLM